MGRPYSDDIRVRVGGAVGAGQSRRGAANRFGVSASSAIRWVSRMASEGTASARMQGRPRGKGPLSDHLAYLTADRKSVVEGKSVSVRVDLGGRRIIKKKKQIHITEQQRIKQK